MKYIKQFMAITGLGSIAFDEAIIGLERWIDHLRKAVHPEKVSDWTPGTMGGYVCLAFTNRIFTPVSNAAESDRLPLPEHWDPKGTLVRATKGEVVHALDNVVQYVVMARSDDDELCMLIRLR